MSFIAKYPGRCNACGNRIQKGDLAGWSEDKKVVCSECDAARDDPYSYGSALHKKAENQPAVAFQPRSQGVPAVRPRLFNTASMGSGPRIGIVAFNKHIATEMQFKLEGNSLLEGSAQQDAIWDAMLTDTRHLVVQAAAGTGKSTSMQQGCLRLRKSVDASAVASTYHSLGLSILRKNLGDVKIDQHKLDDILERILAPRKLTNDRRYVIQTAARKLIQLAKSYLVAGDDRDRLEELVDHHCVDVSQAGDDAYEIVPQAMQLCLEQPHVVDYQDMIWIPVMQGMQGNTFDILIVDEVQDSSADQRALVWLACPSGRIMAVGDSRQACFGFRGAGINAMSDFEEMLRSSSRGCLTLPLTVTRRCPKSHVRMAQAIVGEENIQAMPDAPEGKIDSMGKSEALKRMKPGDMVLCRVNRELVPAAYSLIRRGIKAIVRGRDIGTGLESLIKSLGAPETTLELLERLLVWRGKEKAKLLRQKYSEARIAALDDRCSTLEELCEGADTTAEVVARINQIFADFDEEGKPVNAVVLGTVHRLKGLEANNLYVLAPDLMPHPMARSGWERDQELNLMYVACTRGKYNRIDGIPDENVPGEIIFVGQIPLEYGLKDEEADDPDEGEGEENVDGEEEVESQSPEHSDSH